MGVRSSKWVGLAGDETVADSADEPERPYAPNAAAALQGNDHPPGSADHR